MQVGGVIAFRCHRAGLQSSASVAPECNAVLVPVAFNKLVFVNKSIVVLHFSFPFIKAEDGMEPAPGAEEEERRLNFKYPSVVRYPQFTGKAQECPLCGPRRFVIVRFESTEFNLCVCRIQSVSPFMNMHFELHTSHSFRLKC